MRKFIATAAAALLLLSGVAHAQAPAQPDRSNRGGETRGQDRADDEA